MHRKCAVVVQDLATRWIQSYPRKNQRRRREVLEHFSSRSKIQHHSLEFVKKLAKSWIGIMGDLHRRNPKQMECRRAVSDAVSTHTCRNERRTRTSSSFGTRLSEDFDQITESKKTTELDLNWRSSSSAVAQSVNHLAEPLWESPYGKALIEEGGEKVTGWGCLCFRFVDDIKMIGKLRICRRCGHNCKNKSIWMTQYHSLIRYI